MNNAEIRIPVRKWPVFVLLPIAIVFMLVSIIVFLVMLFKINWLDPNISFTLVLAFVVFVLGLMAVLSGIVIRNCFRQLFNKQPALIINNEGFTNNLAFFKLGSFLWSDVKNIALIESYKLDTRTIRITLTSGKKKIYTDITPTLLKADIMEIYKYYEKEGKNSLRSLIFISWRFLVY